MKNDYKRLDAETFINRITLVGNAGVRTKCQQIPDVVAVYDGFVKRCYKVLGLDN